MEAARAILSLSWQDGKFRQYADVFPGELGSVPLSDRYFYVALLLTHLLYKQEIQLSFPVGCQGLNCMEEGDAELKEILQQRKNGKKYGQDGE